MAGDFSLGNFTLANFEILSRRGYARALYTSFGLAAGAATVAVLLGGLVAWLQVKTRQRGRHLLAALTALPLAAPGTVLKVIGDGIEATATVAALPFYYPQKTRTHA